MAGNVVRFTGVTKLDLPADRILDGAQAAALQGAVVVGYDDDGEFYFASSYADGADALWLLELAKLKLLRIGGGED